MMFHSGLGIFDKYPIARCLHKEGKDLAERYEIDLATTCEVVLISGCMVRQVHLPVVDE